jgi:hypothetical protein
MHLQSLKRYVVLASFVLLTGCSALGTLLGKPGINVDAQVGKENVQQVVGQQKSTKVEAGDNSIVDAGSVDGIKSQTTKSAKVTNSKKSVGSSVDADSVGKLDQKTAEKLQDIKTGDNAQVVVDQREGPSWWILLLLVLGWILPTPAQMLKSLTNKGNKNG